MGAENMVQEKINVEIFPECPVLNCPVHLRYTGAVTRILQISSMLIAVDAVLIS